LPRKPLPGDPLGRRFVAVRLGSLRAVVSVVDRFADVALTPEGAHATKLAYQVKANVEAGRWLPDQDDLDALDEVTAWDVAR